MKKTSENLDSILATAIGKLGRADNITYDLDAPVESLGIDSIGLTELVLEIEEMLGEEMDEELLVGFTDARTLGEMRSIFMERYGEDST